MRKGKDSEPDPYLWIMNIRIRIREAQKHADNADPQHWYLWWWCWRWRSNPGSAHTPPLETPAGHIPHIQYYCTSLAPKIFNCVTTKMSFRKKNNNSVEQKEKTYNNRNRADCKFRMRPDPGPIILNKKYVSQADEQIRIPWSLKKLARQILATQTIIIDIFKNKKRKLAFDQPRENGRGAI